jgi:4-hydroxy-4-methyl-2-oxoglutarate aldolase
MATEHEPLERELLNRLEQIPTSAIADTKRGDVNVMTAAIKPIHTDCAVAGTVRTVTLDPSALWVPVKTLDTARKDEIVVVDVDDCVDEAIWGELLSTYAATIDIRGMVTNGAVRDVSGIRELGFSVFARAVTPRGPSGSEEAERNVQATVGGVSINPGDVLVGDESGVVVIERRAVEDVISAAEAIVETEREVDRLIGEGKSLERALGDAGMI